MHPGLHPLLGFTGMTDHEHPWRMRYQGDAQLQRQVLIRLREWRNTDGHLGLAVTGHNDCDHEENEYHGSLQQQTQFIYQYSGQLVGLTSICFSWA